MIPAEQLRRTEAKCNVLFTSDEDDHPLLRSLEERYGAKIREQLVRPVIKGGVGPVQILLEEEAAAGIVSLQLSHPAASDRCRKQNPSGLVPGGLEA
jgi:hypothetical protein